jgi:hypothetical protein
MTVKMEMSLRDKFEVQSFTHIIFFARALELQIGRQNHLLLQLENSKAQKLVDKKVLTHTAVIGQKLLQIIAGVFHD